MKRNLWAICFSTTLIAFSAYIAFDTFLIPRAVVSGTTVNTSLFAESGDDTAGSSSVTSQSSGSDETDNSSGASYATQSRSDNSTAANPSSSDTSYQDENISVTLTEYYEYNTKIYVADVKLSSAEYLKTAFADNTYGKNITETTSSMAESNNAILAVNGDYYGVQESGYVIRNGVVYRGTAKGSDVLCVYANGTMEVVSDSEYTADELVSKGVWQAFTFGPSLVENGSIAVGVNDEVGKAMASNPRTAIGMIDTNHFVFVVSDGRTSESNGLSLYEMAQFIQKLGVKTAYNLDGGGSSTMYFNGNVINNPTSGRSIKEREVSDIVYIG